MKNILLRILFCGILISCTKKNDPQPAIPTTNQSQLDHSGADTSGSSSDTLTADSFAPDSLRAWIYGATYQVEYYRLSTGERFDSTGFCSSSACNYLAWSAQGAVYEYPSGMSVDGSSYFNHGTYILYGHTNMVCSTNLYTNRIIMLTDYNQKQDYQFAFTYGNMKMVFTRVD